MWWSDRDADGFGSPSAPRLGCRPEDHEVDNDWDCDDADPRIRPRMWRLADDGGVGIPGTEVWSCDEVAGHLPLRDLRR
jgi:hypothetical protein